MCQGTGWSGHCNILFGQGEYGTWLIAIVYTVAGFATAATLLMRRSYIKTQTAQIAQSYTQINVICHKRLPNSKRNREKLPFCYTLMVIYVLFNEQLFAFFSTVWQ
jgi:hypothetical protein